MTDAAAAAAGVEQNGEQDMVSGRVCIQGPVQIRGCKAVWRGADMACMEEGSRVLLRPPQRRKLSAASALTACLSEQGTACFGLSAERFVLCPVCVCERERSGLPVPVPVLVCWYVCVCAL